MIWSQETFLPLSCSIPNCNEFSAVCWWQQGLPFLFYRDEDASVVLCFLCSDYCCSVFTGLYHQGLPSSDPTVLPVFLMSMWWGPWKCVSEDKLPLSLWLSEALYTHSGLLLTLSKSLNISVEFLLPASMETDTPSSCAWKLCSMEAFVFP